MLSRRQILSKSDYSEDIYSTFASQEEDVWYDTQELYKDHIQEVLEKWSKIDDEIWAKIIVFERNRRLAKAYARTPVLTINGSQEAFDGFRIGLNGFGNPARDRQTDEIKRHIGHGIKLKMDDAGNVIIKRVSRCNIYVKNPYRHLQQNALEDGIPNSLDFGLELEKPIKLFDMKKFQTNVRRELRSPYPDRKKLEFQCLTPLVFVHAEYEVLKCPVWILFINIVALDMLKTKLPPLQNFTDIRTRPRVPLPDEDHYSIVATYSSPTDKYAAGVKKKNKTYSDDAPKLPPRRNLNLHDTPKGESSRLNPVRSMTNSSQKLDDPYYSGLRARIPSFVEKSKRQDTQIRQDPRNFQYNRLVSQKIHERSQNRKMSTK